MRRLGVPRAIPVFPPGIFFPASGSRHPAIQVAATLEMPIRSPATSQDLGEAATGLCTRRAGVAILVRQRRASVFKNLFKSMGYFDYRNLHIIVE